VVAELMHAGHEVIGLARSDTSAAALAAVGADVQRGALDDLDSLRLGAASADGIIHLAFVHDFSNFDDALTTDLHAVETMGAALEGSGKPFVIPAHRNGEASERVVIALAERGVRTSVVSLAPSVHGPADRHGFIPGLINIARERGVSAYVGDGSNRWPAVHERDAAHLLRLVLETAPSGSLWRGVGDEGVPFKQISQVIGRHLNVPAVSIAQAEAAAHFGFLGALASLDIPQSSAETRERLGWRPIHPGLIADLEAGFYFDRRAA
ncbi:MAG TPA: SDR family oxidoreductase, partial [Ktedonobacterales bacterium]|nr:SDR family oxidoreductase [Ktedonobacterales bacterium]